jgi:hypothetical protein
MSEQLFNFLKWGICFFSSLALCQGQDLHKVNLDWVKPKSINNEGTQEFVMSFQNASYNFSENSLPLYKTKIRLPENTASVNVEIDILETQAYSAKEKLLLPIKLFQENLSWYISYERKVPFLILSYLPIFSTFKVSQFRYSVDLSYYDFKINEKTTNTNSVLSSGDWYRIKVANDGVHKISSTFLADIGLDMSNVDPRNIQLYGNGGAMLPELNESSRLDDLHENPIYVHGEEDGAFNSDDFVLFYGESPNRWELSSENVFNHIQNIYDTHNYYYLRIGDSYGKRVPMQEEVLVEGKEIDFYTDRKFYEWENTNLKNSGRQWFGEYLGFSEQYTFNFDFKNRIDSELIRLFARGVGRSSISSSLNFSHQGNQILQVPIGTQVSSSVYVDDGEAFSEFISDQDDISINLSYNQNGNSSAFAYLDYIEIQAKCFLMFNGEQLIFSEPSSVEESSVTAFKLNSSFESFLVWDVTHPDSVRSMSLSDENIFKSQTDGLKIFVAHHLSQTNYLNPIFDGPVENQNLHAHETVDFVIITHPDFVEAANRLAQLHIQKDQMSVHVVTTRQIYNEFSSGKQDIVALRSYLRMLYEKADTEDDILDNVLLFGDASFDYKGISSLNTNKLDQNFVPTFQSEYSFKLGPSYCSDDFFGFLDLPEGAQQTINNDGLDVGLGRIVVQSLAQADAMVDKIEHYMSTDSHGDWRSNICFVADDIDDESWEYRLQENIDKIAQDIDTNYHNYNVNKIYLDAYKQESSSGGQRYPSARQAISEVVSSGALIIHYYGHGGEVGWAEERVLVLDDINAWNNLFHLPVFVTATCEFSRYDDPDRVSAGEQVLLNSEGAGIALFSTTRTITENDANNLSRSFYQYAIPEKAGEVLSFGQILKEIKNDLNISGLSTTNKLKFALLGDPALKLPIPQLNVLVQNLVDVDTGLPIYSIKALSKVRVNGIVVNSQGEQFKNFNGVLKPKVFDKPIVLQTQTNDFDYLDPFNFELQQSLLYSGNVSVDGGAFEFEFIVPKDINFAEGNGKFSFYASDDVHDALGSFIDFVVGGINENAGNDEQGPQVDLFLNSVDFMFGGLTDANPNLYALISDESGINTTGNGIGHDIVATLDEDSQTSKVLNQFYESDLDSYKSGVVVYPYTDIEDGAHQLKIKVWDAYNNSSEAFTEFVVINDTDLILKNLMNFPNPFSDFTRIHFEHNRPNDVLEVSLNIFDQMGKLVKTMSNTISNSSYANSDFTWDGSSDFGSTLVSGIYYCQVMVKNSTLEEKKILSNQMVLIK